MIKTMIHAVMANLKEIEWAEKVCGLAIPVTRPIMTIRDGEKYKTGEEIFPISDDLAGRSTLDKGGYLDLLPSSKYKSVIYFEQISPVRFAGFKDMSRRKIWIYEAQTRLVCWLNLKKFGWTKSGLADLANLAIQKKILAEPGEQPNSGRILVLDEFYTGAILDAAIIGNPINDKSIFSKYSVSEVVDNLLYPFEYFAIDINCHFEVGRDCFTEILVNDEIC